MVTIAESFEALTDLAETYHADRQAPEVIKMHLRGFALKRGWPDITPLQIDDLIEQICGRRPEPEPIPPPKNSRNSENSNRPDPAHHVLNSRIFISGDDAGNGTWDDPLPLRREIPPAETFPTEALGRVLQDAAEAMHRIIQAPMALCAQSLLGGAALAVQAHADVQIDGRTYPTSEFFITVAESGERKTAADQAALAPHNRRQRDLRDEFEAQQTEYEMESMAWKQARQDAIASKKSRDCRAKVAALKEIGGKPPAPVDPILMVAEPTYEGIYKALAGGWPSMGLFSDEGGRFVGGYAMNRDNQLKTAAGLSELWGGKPINRSRGGDGSSLLYGRRVSLHLMMQPCVAQLLFNNDLLSGQGMLARCLVAWPESRIGMRPYREENLRETLAMRHYFGRFMELLKAPLPLVAGRQNELNPRLLPLSPAAKRAWIGFHDHVEKLSKPDQPLHSIKELAGKSAEHAGRLAGIIALVEDLSITAISPEFMEAGIKLAQYYLGEALRLFQVASDNPDLALAEQCLAWGRARGGRFAMVALYQYGPNPVRDKATALRILKILADHGWARPLPAGSLVEDKPRRNAWEVKP